TRSATSCRSAYPLARTGPSPSPRGPSRCAAPRRTRPRARRHDRPGSGKTRNTPRRVSKLDLRPDVGRGVVETANIMILQVIASRATWRGTSQAWMTRCGRGLRRTIAGGVVGVGKSLLRRRPDWDQPDLCPADETDGDSAGLRRLCRSWVERRG